MNKAKDFGKRLAECRRNSNFTQEELANRIGVTPQALSKWENGLSSPDLSLFSSLCEILEMSSDYLLGLSGDRITENGNEETQDRIWYNLRTCLEPLSLVFGEGIVPLFVNNPDFVEQISTLRINLSTEGILMPIVRVKDHYFLKKNEFMILSYENVLYEEELDSIDEHSLEYIIEKLGWITKNKYAEIISVDILKKLTDNLKIEYPALIEGIVPEQISYGLLLEVTKNFMNRGNSLLYLPKIIESMECHLRNNENISTTELIDRVCKDIERKDNFWIKRFS